MPELIITLEAIHKKDYEDKKFLAAIQGVDIDKGSQSDADKVWERALTKARTGGAVDNPDDILSLQGTAAAQAGFGIGLGLDYEVV